MNYLSHFRLIYFNIGVDYLLMLTIFHVQNVLIILVDIYVIFLYQNICSNYTHTSYLDSFLSLFFMHLLFLASSFCLDQ